MGVPQKTTGTSITKTSLPSLPLTLQRLADPKRFHEVLGGVPVKIDQLLDIPSIAAVIHAGATKESIEGCLALEIAKASNAITTGGNLRQGQSLEIAQQIIDRYPNESLEDFCFCLRRGLQGRYTEAGKLFRFDVVVVFEWIEKFMEEKYQAIEDRMMNEKDKQYQSFTNPNYIQLLKEAVAVSDNKGMQAVPKLSPAEIQKEGKEKRKFVAYPSTSESEVNKRLLHLEYIRQNYDARTGDKLLSWMPEEEWLNSNR